MSDEVIDAEVISAETIEEPSGPQPKIYDVTVVTHFQVLGPSEVPDMKILERALWEAMPAGNIGGDFFVKFPRSARNFNVEIKAEVAEEQEDAKLVPLEELNKEDVN
jgi:hypothetical protein